MTSKKPINQSSIVALHFHCCVQCTVRIFSLRFESVIVLWHHRNCCEIIIIINQNNQI